MAEHIVSLIPRLHTYRTNPAMAEAAVTALKKMVEADEITFTQTDAPEFVDCGSDLMEVRCPKCNALLPQAWWGEKMDEMYAQSHFLILEQEMPCCGKTASFNDLRYHAPCGFSALKFTIRNPKAAVGKEATEYLGERFGILFKMVESHL